MSVEWELTNMGDIQLVVCGDVHFDLCMDDLTKIAPFEILRSPIHI